MNCPFNIKIYLNFSFFLKKILSISSLLKNPKKTNQPFFEFIFTDEKLFKYCKEFELYNSKEQKVLDILKSGDYKEINIKKINRKYKNKQKV